MVKYRRDIDGLRAVAVVPVVLFHAGLTLFSGGFVGVDVFFVISGFLITSIILSEIKAGEFSVAKFYQRRILRIFPALAAVLIATLVIGYLVMLPTEFLGLGKSLAATTFFLSNVFFWRDTSYFDGAADFKPLLHTWSLAVEEQFYIFFPLLLVLVGKFFQKRMALAIGVLIAVTFLLSEWMLKRNASAAFYLLPSRTWELGFGALVAAGGIPKIASEKGRNVAAAVAALLLLGSIFLLNNTMPFPGAAALPACLGAALLIAYGRDTAVAKVLETKPMVAIGLISYSLYLWHWPVFVFLRLNYGLHLPVPVMIAGIAVSGLAATACYYWVETPFRTKRFRAMPARPVLLGGVAYLGVFGLLGVGVVKLHIHRGGVPSDVLQLASFEGYRKKPDYKEQFRVGSCLIGTGENDGFGKFDQKQCLPMDAKRRNFLVLGDSHAGHIWKALSEQYPDATFGQATASGCRPLVNAKGAKACTDMMKFMYNEYLPKHRYDAIFLAARWKDSDLSSIEATARELTKYANKVVVLGPTVEYEGDVPALLARAKLRGDAHIQGFLDPHPRELDAKIRPLVEATGAKYVSMQDMVCPQGENAPCLEQTSDGTPMQFDYGHFTLAGSRIIAAKIKAMLPDLVAKS